MRKQRLLFAALLLACCSYLGSCAKDELGTTHYEKGDAVDLTIPVPISGHPRLFVTPDDLGDLKRRWNSSNPMLVALKEEVKTQAEWVNSGVVAEGKPSYRYKIGRAFEANALLYLIEGNVKAGEKAKKLLLEYTGSLGTHLNPPAEQFGIFEGRDVSRSIMGAGIVLDWCYDLFTGAEIKQLIADVDRLGLLYDYKEFGGWPIYPENKPLSYYFSRWSEDKHPYHMAFGIASYDVDPELYTLMADHLYNGFVELRNYAYQAERPFFGSAYGGERMQADFVTTKLMTAMGYPRPYDDRQKEVLTGLIQMRRPDGYMMPEGDDWLIQNTLSPKTFTHMLALLISVNEYEDPYQHDELLRCWASLDGNRDAALYMALYNDKAPIAPVSELPLTKYYGHPQGNMIARTSWETGAEANTAMVKTDMRSFANSAHTHFDTGHFSIYYKGPLAIDSGVYGSYGSTHFRNYLIRTYAHNTLLIYDGAGTVGDQVDNWGTFENIAEYENNHGTAVLLEHGYGPDKDLPEYSYMKGDMALSYGARAKVAKRSFVALNFLDETYPGALIVYDKVITPEASTKKWMLHSEEEPVIEGNTISIKASTKKNPDFRGLLVEQLLYPSLDNAKIEPIGGPDKEFFVEGVNWPIDEGQDPILKEAGSWRIEISNTEKSTDQRFLNVLHYKTADDGNPNLNAVAIESDELIGTAIKDRVVLFSKSGERLGGSLTFTIDGSGDYKALITDLQTGLWNVNGRMVYVTEEEGCIYAELPAGTYTIQKK